MQLNSLQSVQSMTITRLHSSHWSDMIGGHSCRNRRMLCGRTRNRILLAPTMLTMTSCCVRSAYAHLRRTAAMTKQPNKAPTPLRHAVHFGKLQRPGDRSTSQVMEIEDILNLTSLRTSMTRHRVTAEPRRNTRESLFNLWRRRRRSKTRRLITSDQVTKCLPET